MSRSVKKGPYVAPELLKRVEEMNKKNEKQVLKTWSRSSTIFPAFVGHTIAVHGYRQQAFGHWRYLGDHYCGRRAGDSAGAGIPDADAPV